MDDGDVYWFYVFLGLAAVGLILAAIFFGPLDGITTYF